MMIQNIHQILIDLCNKTHPRGLEWEIRKNPNLLDFVETYWNPNWGQPRIFLEKVWHAVHSTSPLCEQGSKMGWLSWKNGTVFCQNSCICARSAREKTMIERHGVSHALKSQQFKDKAKQTWVNKYGVDQLSQINVEQKKQTNLLRYGANTPLESNEIRGKIQKSSQQRLGVNYPFESLDIQSQIQKKWIETTGKKSFARSADDIANQNLKIMTDRLGDKMPFIMDQQLFVDSLRQMSRIEFANFVGCSTSLIDKRIAEWDLTEFQQGLSHYEIVIGNFIDQLGITAEKNNRRIIPPKEIDWWIPSHKLGIEFCGLRWHGEAIGRGRSYHLQKLNDMQSQGFSLITIFQDEWDNNSTIVKSILANKLSQPPVQKIWARKTSLVELSNNSYSEFVDKNHIQGAPVGDILRLGLYEQDQLMAVTGFRKNQKYGWEVSRHANKINCQVVGGFGKMFAHFLKRFDPDQVISYADRRYFTGQSLQHNGFSLCGATDPGYFYTKGINRYHRSNFTKQKLIEQGFDIDQTENQIMINRGYDVIWDCGHLRWVWSK